jgi:putative sugar O-methyltransferase
MQDLQIGLWLKFNDNKSMDMKQPAQNALVIDAKARLAEALTFSSNGLPEHGKRWDAYARRSRSAIGKLRTPEDVLMFAQTQIGFEHRGNIHHEGKFTALYERELAASYPHFVDRLTDFADIEDSAPETTYLHNGRLISNVLFYLARVVMSCLSHLPTPPKIVLEVGGGYGAPARLWMKNLTPHPRCYLILDMPESLFFADVFLRKEFGNESVFYVNSVEPLCVDNLDKFKFILCPLSFFASILNLPVDLVINTGSLQEMSEEWVDFYKGWLDRQHCHWFYSLNYFAQPVNALWESGNLLSPRLSPLWTARLLRWNPAFVRMQTDRNYLEALYEKTEKAWDPAEAKIILRYLVSRDPSGEVLVELMDLIRSCPDNELMLKVLAFAMRMADAPKEALWLAETLLLRPIGEADRVAVENWHRDLTVKRASGTEAYY